MQSEEQETLQDLAILMSRRLGQPWHTWDVQRALEESGYVWKCVVNRAAEACPEKQQLFIDTCLMHGCTACNYVYLDEVGTDSRVTNKRRGWIQKGEDSETSKMIFVRGRKFTTIAAMCTTGIVATLTFEGAADKKTLLTFIIESVIPHMNPFPGEKSVLIMDNAAIHDKSALSVLGQLHNFMVIPLPPYSPIFNPIENICSAPTRHGCDGTEISSATSAHMMPPIDLAMRSITPKMCNNWIRAVPFYDRD